MNGVSVIICTYNGRQRLEPTIFHILKLEAVCAWELIIIDNASSDSTSEYCSELLASSGGQLCWRIIYEEKPGLIHARLRGLRESKYGIVLYCDDDNSLSADYLQIGFEIFKDNPNVGALGGFGIPVFEVNKKPTWFDRYSHSFAVGPQSSHDGKLMEFPAELYGAGTFLRKEVILYFYDRGFETVMTGRVGNKLVSGDDVEWCYLIQLLNYEIWYDHRLTFTHRMPAARMQWKYYLKLKEGIASGAASFLPYTCLFKDRSMGVIGFGMHWFLNGLKSTLIFMYNKFKMSLISTLTPEIELANLILRAKATSYWSDGVKSFKHFIHLRKML